MWWLLACLTSEAPPTPSVVSQEMPLVAPPPGEMSGAFLQDPTGFPRFHGQAAPAGAAPGPAGAWTGLEELSGAEGGLRPQIASDASGGLQLVYYANTPDGDLLRHRRRPAGGAWTAPEGFGDADGRNWGPDLVVRADGSAVVSYDHTDLSAGFAGQVKLARWDGAWSAPEAVTPLDGREVGSAHVADGAGADLALVWIERALEPGAPFRAMGGWWRGGAWTDAVALIDDAREAWHTNVERRPDGSVLAGWDLGHGGGENEVLVAVGRDGVWGQAQDLSAGKWPGERPHFAFAAPGGAGGLVGVFSIWFHRLMDRPLHVYVREDDGRVTDLAAGLGGFHFDPEIAIRPDGSLVAVWGWDGGDDAALVYAVRDSAGWSKPARVARQDGVELGMKPGLPSLTITPDGAVYAVWVWWRRGQSTVWGARLGG